MKEKLLSSVALLCVAGSAIAAERAVEAVHYQAGLDGQYLDYDYGDLANSDSQSSLGALNGAITLPLGPLLGAKLGAQYSHLVGDTSYGSTKYDIEGDGFTGSALLFYRQPSVGRISFGYERTRSEVTVSYGSGYQQTSRGTDYSYLGLIEGYLGPVTLAVTDTRSFYDGDTGHEDVSFVSAQWYVVPQVRLGMQVGFQEAKNGYIAEAEFQPSFLGNRAGIYVAYLRVDDDYDDVTANGIRLGINFYFDKRFDLITRDRHYR